MNIINKIYATDPWAEIDPPVSSDFSTWEGVLRKIYELFDFFVPFSVIVAITMIVVGGYSLIISNGDPEKIKKGSDIITAAVVGMILVFLSKLIVKFIIDKVFPT